MVQGFGEAEMLPEGQAGPAAHERVGRVPVQSLNVPVEQVA